MPFQITRIRSKGRSRKLRAIQILRHSTYLASSAFPDQSMGLREAKDIVDALIDTYAVKPYVSPALTFSTDLSRRVPVSEFEEYFEVTPIVEAKTLKLFRVTVYVTGRKNTKYKALVLSLDERGAKATVGMDTPMAMDEEVHQMDVEEVEGPFKSQTLMIEKSL